MFVGQLGFGSGLAGSGGVASDFIPGKTVANFAALPGAGSNIGLLAIAVAAQGVWMVNYKARGIYYSDGATWTYQGDYELTDEASEIQNTPSGGISATNVQTALNELDGDKVNINGAITGATKTKITYDTKGLVTIGDDATTADIADSSNKRYVTDAQLTVISNTSGVNTGDQTNITGNAATVTTNANLTGQVTSTGNAALLDKTAITGQGAVAVAAADKILFADASSGDALARCTAQDIANLASGSNKTSATVTLADEPQSVVVTAAWVAANTDIIFSFTNPTTWPDELLIAAPYAVVESLDVGVGFTARFFNADGVMGTVTMNCFQG
jgi:hypothetical protein